jgi:hypothetical protein
VRLVRTAAQDRAALIALLPEHARHTQDRLVRILASKQIKPFGLNLETPAPILPQS